MDETAKAILTVSGVLFGFFFAAFWWILDRELTFSRAERHFKPATGVLMGSMLLLATFGIVGPLRQAAKVNPAAVPSYRGILLALIAIYGYMLIELGHYSVYQWPKYTTRSEKAILILTLGTLAVLAFKWWVLK